MDLKETILYVVEACQVFDKKNMPSADMILDVSVRIFNTQRMNEKPETGKRNTDEKITEKQIAFLEKNQYRGNINKLTREQARVIIKEFIEGQNKEDY